MQIEVRQAPIYNEPTDIYRCDYNDNGLNTVDLNEKNDEITNGVTQDLSVSFHLTPLNANIGTNALPLNYTTTVNPQLIYARVENLASGCHSLSTFNITTLALPEVNFNQSLVKCGNNYEFEQQWNLTDIDLLILEGRQYGVEFSYYESEADLQNDTNPIQNFETYTNTSNPQTIFAKVLNVSTTCFASVPFSLILNAPPIINDIEAYNICENEDSSLNLLDINDVLFDDTFNVLISYHSSEADADANENALNSDYTYTNTAETIFVRAEYSTTHCYAVYPFMLNVNPIPVANQPNDLVACNDDFDGFMEFDLSQQNATILNGQNPDNHTITFHNSEENAIENNEVLNTEYIGFNGEIIFVRLTNNETSCFDITQFLVLINPIPFVSIENQVVCLNELPLIVSANTNNPFDSYLWSTNAITPEIEISETGTYSVTITNEFGCESTSTFNVTESESAEIDVIETIDFSDPNNITVTVNGIGNYLYQLNDGPFQTSNVFVNVPIGNNTITIIDQNGCARVTREVLVIDTPKHLSPNDDGDFDTWHITGVETLPGTVIHIFDRYGKLLKELGHNTSGWDGTFNGNDMSAGDYWYVANVVQNGEIFQVKGHFALRR
jgi:gliding motility-associated-like protein